MQAQGCLNIAAGQGERVFEQTQQMFLHKNLYHDPEGEKWKKLLGFLLTVEKWRILSKEIAMYFQSCEGEMGVKNSFVHLLSK